MAAAPSPSTEPKLDVYKRQSILTITDDHSSPAVPFSQYILICQTKTEIFYNSLTLPIAMVNLISSYLAMDLLPPAKRQDFMDTLSS